jgi:hypothetical protein
MLHQLKCMTQEGTQSINNYITLDVTNQFIISSMNWFEGTVKFLVYVYSDVTIVA